VFGLLQSRKDAKGSCCRVEGFVVIKGVRGEESKSVDGIKKRRGKGEKVLAMGDK
jgi:hypothetical protein